MESQHPYQRVPSTPHLATGRRVGVTLGVICCPRTVLTERWRGPSALLFSFWSDEVQVLVFSFHFLFFLHNLIFTINFKISFLGFFFLIPVGKLVVPVAPFLSLFEGKVKK